MRTSFILLFLTLVPVCSASAEPLRMRDLFAAMPDSIMPLLTTNNRLDCIDFAENNMEAKVRNRLDEFSELQRLTPDYLLMQTSPTSRTEMKMLSTSDTTATVVVVRTVHGPEPDSEVLLFDEHWRRLPLPASLTRPSVDAFFTTVTPDMERLSVVAQLRDLPLLEARLSPDAPTVTWSLSLSFLPKEERECAKGELRQVVREL